MSSTPKRLHDDGSSASGSGSVNQNTPSAVKYPHEDPGTHAVVSGKMVAPARHEYHTSYEMAPESRTPKIAPRNDSRDSERRSAMLPNLLYRVPTSIDLPQESHASDSRMDFRDINDSAKDVKLEAGELKVEPRDFQQTVNSVKYDNRTEDCNKVDALKEGLQIEGRELGEAREAMGENRVEIKGDDKQRDKDRRRKEVKHWDLGERDKERNDRRNNLQPANLVVEIKDVLREERDSERSGNDRKELQKDKEKLNEKEKDHVKAEPWNASDREASHSEKEIGDIPAKCFELEKSTLEPKKKDSDMPKNIDREVRDKKKERETDVEPERSEKRGKFHEKESDDGDLHVEGSLEREREIFNSGVAQRKRMLRPRSSPQRGNRDSRFRPGSNEIDGPQNKSDVSYVYKIGECMRELVKLWTEYEHSQIEKACESSQNGPTLEIRIPAEHVTATNRQVRGGQLWGTDVYTVDSDLVAVLMHTGYCRPTASPPPSSALELRATVRVLPPQECYISTLRNNVRSRAWGSAIGCSYRVERCCIVKKGGGIIELEPCLTHSSTMEPTLAPVAVERTMTTRAAASNALRQQKFVREVTIQFNLCMEPWLKYSISAVADKGLKKSLFTSARLKKGEVLYAETHTKRYELCFMGEKVAKTQAAETGKIQCLNGGVDGESSSSVVVDLFRWSRCKRPLPQKYMLSVGIPLPWEHVEILEENVEWEEILWSQTGVWIGGKEYQLARAHFLAPLNNNK